MELLISWEEANVGGRSMGIKQQHFPYVLNKLGIATFSIIVTNLTAGFASSRFVAVCDVTILKHIDHVALHSSFIESLKQIRKFWVEVPKSRKRKKINNRPGKTVDGDPFRYINDGAKTSYKDSHVELK